jgi:hypothetical protein
MSQNETSESSVTPTQTPEDGIIIPFIKELKTRLPKAQIEQNLWITKSGLFVRSEYQNDIIEAFKDFYKSQTNSDISEEKASRKLFDDYQSDRFFLLIGHSIVVGSLVACKTNELRGIGIRLYEGIPMDCANSIHQSDPIFAQSPQLVAKLSRNGYVAQISTKHKTFEIPFDQISSIRDAFKHSKDLSKYLDTSTLRGFVKTFSASLARTKPFQINLFTIFPKQVLSAKNVNWLRVGETVLLEQNGQILYVVPLKGRAHEEMIRNELNLLVKEYGRRRLAGASLNLRKDSFSADYEVQGITHHFGVSAVFSFLDGVIDYHTQFGSYPGRLAKKSSVEEVIKCFTWILRDAQPILADKIPVSVKEDATSEVTSFISTASEWYFGVDRTKMIRQVWFRPKVQKKTIVPINLPANLQINLEPKKPDGD